MTEEKLIELLIQLLSEDSNKKESIQQNENNGLSNYCGKYVVIATDEKKRGVFFGKLKHLDREKQVAVIEEAQMAVYWSTETKGFNNLAVIGPQEGSRITSGAPEMELYGVSCVMMASYEAIKAWKLKPWS